MADCAFVCMCTGVRPLSAASAEQQFIDAQLRAELDGVARRRHTDEENLARAPGCPDGGSGGGGWYGHATTIGHVQQPRGGVNGSAAPEEAPAVAAAATGGRGVGRYGEARPAAQVGLQSVGTSHEGPATGGPAPHVHGGPAPAGYVPGPAPAGGPSRHPAPGGAIWGGQGYGLGPSAGPNWPGAGWAQDRPGPSDMPSGGGHPCECGGEGGRARGPMLAPQTNHGARGNRHGPEWGPVPMASWGGEHPGIHTVGLGAAAPTAVGARGGLARGRRRRRSNDSGSPPRRRRQREPSPSTASSSSDEDMEDRRQVYRRAPVRSTAAAAPANLRLPTIQARAERQLRNRRRFVAVADAVDAADARPASSVEYACRVAEIMTHTVYHFPESGLQAISYMAWLLWQAARHPLRAVAAADSRARQTMALRPRDYLTAADLDRFMVPATGVGNGRTTEGGRGETRRGQTCFLYELSNACRSPCREGRYHPRCRACGSHDHPTAFHGPTGAGHRGGSGGAATSRRGGAGRGGPGRGGLFR